MYASEVVEWVEFCVDMLARIVRIKEDKWCSKNRNRIDVYASAAEIFLYAHILCSIVGHLQSRLQQISEASLSTQQPNWTKEQINLRWNFIRKLSYFKATSTWQCRSGIKGSSRVTTPPILALCVVIWLPDPEEGLSKLVVCEGPGFRRPTPF